MIQNQIKFTETKTLKTRSKPKQTNCFLIHEIIIFLPSCTSSPAVRSPNTWENFHSSGGGGPAAADATSPPSPLSILLNNQKIPKVQIEQESKIERKKQPNLFPFLFSLHWKRKKKRRADLELGNRRRSEQQQRRVGFRFNHFSVCVYIQHRLVQ